MDKEKLAAVETLIARGVLDSADLIQMAKLLEFMGTSDMDDLHAPVRKPTSRERGQQESTLARRLLLRT